MGNDPPGRDGRDDLRLRGLRRRAPDGGRGAVALVAVLCCASAFSATAAARDVASTTGKPRSALPSYRWTVSNVTVLPDGVVGFDVRTPARGTVDVLETAWTNNEVSDAVVLQPAKGRFVFARAHTAVRRGEVHITVHPSARGRQLVLHHAYPLTIRVWVTYTPSGGHPVSIGIKGVPVAS